MPRVRVVRAFAACLVALCIAHGGCPGNVPAPTAGAPDYQSLAFVAVPFARVNVLGGNLLVERRDLDLDTRLGNLRLGAVWNSADPTWRFGFELSYDGTLLVDASGARHFVANLPSGQAVPGTIWVRVDARTLRTKGGLVHEFDADGRLAAVRWASGAYPRLEYRRALVGGASRLQEIRQLAGAGDATQLARFAYDAAGRLATIDDRAGRRATFSWSAEGRLLAARDPLDVERGWPGFRYEYTDGKLAAIVSSEGVRAEIAYAGPRVAEVRARGEGDPRIRFAYAAAGGQLVTTVTDPLGNASRHAWDATRRVLSIENALGERSVWTWQGLRPSSFTGPDGVATSWSWADDEPVLEAQASGNVVRFVWELAGENRRDPTRRALRSSADALGPLEQNEYDDRGRLVRTTNGAGESWSFAWNGDNLLASSSDPAGVETRFRDHGAHGHPHRVERAGRSETRDYDAAGNLLAGSGSADLPGAGDTGVVSRSYDADRNLAGLLLGDLDLAGPLETRSLRIDYRSDGQPLRIARPEGGDSEFGYDALGRLAERRDRAAGAWRTTHIERDLLGRPTASVRPNGMETRIEYDAAGRTSLLVQLRGGAFESAAGFGYAAGRLASIVDSAHGYAEETYRYDAAGRPSAVVYPGGERLELAFDLRSRPVEERYVARAGGELRRLRFAYDLADREVELRDGALPLRGLSFQAGRLAEERFGNGLVRSYVYAEDGLLRDVTMRDAAGTLVERSRYEQVPIVSHAQWRASTSSYGALVASSHESFLLAPIGEGLPGPRAAGFASDPEGIAFLTLAYDVLGNLVRTGEPSAAQRRAFSYDGERTRLLRIRRADGATLHQYAYDEAGFAVTRDGEAIVWDGGGRATAVGDRASFRWDTLGRPVATTLEGVEQRHLFGGRVRASAGGVPLSIELSAVELSLLGAHRYRHLDFRGNVKLLSDAQGRIVAHLRYGPYGVDRVDGAPDAAAGFAQGRSLGDLMLLGSRLFDPDAARFLAPDPVFQLVNQYTYAAGNPVWYWDPDGRSPQAATAVALGAALGLSVAAALTGNVPLVIFAGSFAVGLVVPPTQSAAAIAATSGAAARFSGLPFALQAPFAGFVAGQALQGAFHDPAGPAGADGRNGDPRHGAQRKELDLRAETAVVGGPTGGTSPGPGGCSPASLAIASPGRARETLLVLAALQLVLFWAVRRRQRG